VARGTGNAAFAAGTKAVAESGGTGNLAVAVGNPGPNSGLIVDNLIIPATPSGGTHALASGTFNRAFAFGDGSTATAIGGDPANPLTSVGNNTAITLSNGTNSYAGQLPPAFNTSNSPNNQFAFAGPGKNAINGINP
jgi:hypothetical protein